jgi:pimeloyl-ACP methyl ester carboxylesterase/CheY-like chemotaxis protein
MIHARFSLISYVTDNLHDPNIPQATNKLAKRLLEEKGYKVESVTNSVDCFMALENKEYSVLLVNENLTGKDAVSIASWIRQNEIATNRHVKMRILVIVRNILSVNYHAYETTFVDGFLPMPVEGSKLVSSIQKAARHYLESLLLAERCKQIADANNNAVRCPPEETVGRDQTQKQHPKRSDAPTSNGPAKMAKSPSAKNAVRGLSEKLKKKCPVAYESKFQYDENTSFPYTIVENCSDESAPHSTEVKQTPWCNLVVCQDVFDTYERFKIFFVPMVSRYGGMKILLWNYPGQAFTSFSEDANLNNKYHADCLAKLLDHLKDTDKVQFSLDQPFFILAHGSGAAIATYFAATQQSTNLKGIILVNGLSHVDSHYASVFHDCRNVFSCSPESRPDLPVYFYARFLFSPSYLSKTTSSLALNVYTAVHNPITLNGRKRLCQGVLNHVDTRPLLKDIGSPIISIHGENDTLVRSIHSSEFLTGRRSCPTIPQALRGGNRTSIVMMKGGHELFQEKKYHISLLVEQILTGFHDKIRIQHNPTVDSTLQELGIREDSNSNDANNSLHPTKQVEDNFIDKVVQQGREGQSSWDKYHDEIMADQNKCPSSSGIVQKDKNPKASEEKKQFDPNEYPEVKEYMAWRIKRHKKRSAELDRSARIIQCALRCFMAKTAMSRLKKQQAATVIQSYTRGTFGRRIYQQKKMELWAAMLVQRAIRGHSGRCISYQKRMERKAQINLARMMRGMLSRRRFRAVLKKREYSATKIQSLWRMQAAIIMKKFHRGRRDASTTIQKVYRGHLGRRKAALERDKYIFSRSQNSGIELGRQMLAEHKLHATKLQSDISLLNQEKDKMEKQIEFHLKEISNFERTVSELEKKMHHLSKVERQSLGVLASPKEHIVREEKRRMDEEFSETLVKISDRKEKLEKLEKTFEQLLRDREQKFGQLKNLEGKLAVLLDVQETALEGIRKKQEQRIESVVLSDSLPYHSYQPTPNHSKTGQRLTAPPDSSLQQHNHYCSGPSEKDKMQASQLIDSTETMLKFGFMSMSLTYFSTLNMMRAMQRVAVSDTLGGAADGIQSINTAANPTMPTSNAAVRVGTWSVNDVSRWLTSISLSQYQSSFKEGAVDGSFLCELTDDDLRNTLGVEHRLHRKKILFSIRCLKNYADNQVAQSPTIANANIQPQNFMGNGKSVDATSPNSTMHNDSKMIDPRSDGYSLYSNQDRNHEPLSESPAKSKSVLDMLTPTRPKKVRYLYLRNSSNRLTVT